MNSRESCQWNRVDKLNRRNPSDARPQCDVGDGLSLDCYGSVSEDWPLTRLFWLVHFRTSSFRSCNQTLVTTFLRAGGRHFRQKPLCFLMSERYWIGLAVALATERVKVVAEHDAKASSRSDKSWCPARSGAVCVCDHDEDVSECRSTAADRARLGPVQ